MEWLAVIWAWLLANWQNVVFVTALPFVANFVSRSKWDGSTRGFVAMGFCVLVGFGTPFAMHIAFVPANAIMLASALFGGTTAAYLVFKRYKVTCQWLDFLLHIESSDI